MKRSQLATNIAVLCLLVAGGCSSTSNQGTVQSSARSVSGQCNSTGEAGQTCTGGEQYEQCLMAKCDNQYQQCLGPSYKAGAYSGPCAAAMNCLLGCACGDLNCELGCQTKYTDECESCSEAADDCEKSSGCQQPVCSGGTSGGSGGSATPLGGTGGSASPTLGSGGSAVPGAGGSSGAPNGQGGVDPATTTLDHCPYTAAAFDCTTTCANLKAIAAKCDTDPTVPTNIQAVLLAAASGTGAGCKTLCAAQSPQYAAQWSCFQAVPVTSDCSAIAGCTLGNCP